MPRQAREKIQGGVPRKKSIGVIPTYKKGPGHGKKTNSLLEPIPSTKKERRKKAPKHFGDTFEMPDMMK